MSGHVENMSAILFTMSGDAVNMSAILFTMSGDAVNSVGHNVCRSIVSCLFSILVLVVFTNCLDRQN